MFTLRIRRGRPWVLLSNPEMAKQVFTREPELIGAAAGEANPLLTPLLWPDMQAVSLEVVVRSVFGESEGPRLEELRRRLLTMTNWINDVGASTSVMSSVSCASDDGVFVNATRRCKRTPVRETHVA